jgi:hypothetical protein
LTGPNDLGIQFDLDRVQNITSNKPIDIALEKFLIDNNKGCWNTNNTRAGIIIVSINKVSITFKIQNSNSAWTFEFNPQAIYTTYTGASNVLCVFSRLSSLNFASSRGTNQKVLVSNMAHYRSQI